MTCPTCGRVASVVGLPNHVYPTTHYACCGRRWCVDVTQHPEAAEDARRSRAESVANAAALSTQEGGATP